MLWSARGASQLLFIRIIVHNECFNDMTFRVSVIHDEATSNEVSDEERCSNGGVSVIPSIAVYQPDAAGLGCRSPQRD